MEQLSLFPVSPWFRKIVPCGAYWGASEKCTKSLYLLVPGGGSSGNLGWHVDGYIGHSFELAYIHRRWWEVWQPKVRKNYRWFARYVE